MKKFIIALAVLGSSIPVFANITGNGYYRVRNYGSERWANLIDNQAATDFLSGTVDLHSLQLNNDTEEILSQPGSIVYLTNISGNTFDMAAQGLTLGQLVNNSLNIGEDGTAENGQTLYRIYGTYKGAMRTIGDKQTSLSKQYGVAAVDVANKKFNKWYFEPVDVYSSNYFGTIPTVTVGNKLYTTLFTSFAYVPYSPEVKAYYVNRVGFGMAELVEIEGAVPPGSPVVIQCAGPKVEDNKLQLIENQDALPWNSLSGVYFNYQSNSTSNYIGYDPKTMRVLGVCSDGSLGFVTAENLESIPANSAYLWVPEGSSTEFKCVTPEVYATTLPEEPEAFYITEDYELLPQGNDIYSNTFDISALNGSDKDLKLRIYPSSENPQQDYLGPYTSSSNNVKIDLYETATSVPFQYNSPAYWVLSNWPGGDLTVSVNLKFGYVSFYSKSAGIDEIFSGDDSLVYANNVVYCPAICKITVYDMAGKSMVSVNSDSLNLENLPKGFYIVVADGKSIKIVR